MYTAVCISRRGIFPKQIEVGKIYYLDNTDTYQDSDGDSYIGVYTLQKNFIGKLCREHFSPIKTSTNIMRCRPRRVKDAIGVCKYCDSDAVLRNWYKDYSDGAPHWSVTCTNPNCINHTAECSSKSAAMAAWKSAGNFIK